MSPVLHIVTCPMLHNWPRENQTRPDTVYNAMKRMGDICVWNTYRVILTSKSQVLAWMLLNGLMLSGGTRTYSCVAAGVQPMISILAHGFPPSLNTRFSSLSTNVWFSSHNYSDVDCSWSPWNSGFSLYPLIFYKQWA